ncbi:Uncharacterized protein FKW44_000080, partial [Caligus rogercresseyi]
GLMNVPGSAPIDATSLHLDGITLRTYWLGSNASFAGLPKLTILDLSQNRLQELNGPEFTGLESTLRELYLQGNQLVRMKSSAFRNLGELRVLRLDGNLLISFPVWSLAHNPSLTSLYLAHNWWQCDCTFVSRFREFIDDHLDIVSDYQSITCTSRDGQTRPCTNTSESCFDRWRIPLLFFLVIFLSIFGVREALRIWLHSKYGIRLQIGRRECSSESKGPPSCKCIYHQRDLCGNYHSEGFKSSLSASSNTIVIMSSHFVEFEWDAFTGSLDSKLGSTEQERAIVILLESKKDILNAASNERKKSEIRNFWRKDCKKVLSYEKENNDYFWKALRYYLKDPLFPSSREGGAELDRSGIWSFSNNFEEDPMDSSTTPMLNQLLLTSRTPPMKKQCTSSAPHRHSISQLNPSLTTSGIIAAPAERVIQHQRSVSAIAGSNEQQQQQARRPPVHGSPWRQHSTPLIILPLLLEESSMIDPPKYGSHIETPSITQRLEIIYIPDPLLHPSVSQMALFSKQTEEVIE